LKIQKSAIIVISFIILVTALSIVPAKGSTGGGITQYTITSTSTGQMYKSVNFQTNLNTNNQPILAGDELTITFTINANLATGADLKVSTNMNHSSLKQVYWELIGSYSGLDSASLNPNQNYVNFKQTAGSLQLKCYGFFPSSLTQTTVEGITLHRKQNPTIITLYGSSGQVLDQVAVEIIDSKISQFRTVDSTANSKINSITGVDPAYVSLYKTILSNAEAAANQGFVDNAINDLNSLISGQSPQSVQTPILATLFIPAVAVLVVVAVITTFLFMRARGKSSYYSLIIEDQIKDLEGVTMRAARIDRSIASNLEGIKERLQQLVGA